MRNRFLGWTLGAFVAVFAFNGLSHAEAQTKLRLNIIAPPQNWLTQELSAWAQDASAATEGRVVIEAVAAPLGPIPRVFDMIETGVVDVSPGQHGPTPGRFQATQILDIGFVAPTAEAASVAFWRTYEKYLADVDEHKGVHVLGLWATASSHFMSRTSVLSRPADIAGQKYIAVSRTAGKIAGSFGATPVGGPPFKWFEMLSRGIADGAVTSSTAAQVFKLGSVMKSAYIFEKSLFRTSFFLAANQGAWDKISAEDRAAIMAVSGEKLARRMGALFDREDRNAMAELEKSGVRIVKATPDVETEVREKLSFLETDWKEKARARGVDADAAVEMIRAEAAKYKPGS